MRRHSALMFLSALLVTLLGSSSLYAGQAVSWGSNAFGALGDGTITSRPSPVDVLNLTGGVTIESTGNGHSLVVKDGLLYSIGWNKFGQLGKGNYTDSSVPVQVPGLTNVTSVAAGSVHSLAVSNGAAYEWGLMNGVNVPAQVPELSTGVTVVAAGEYHSFAVKDGGLYAWGQNLDGQLGDGTTTSRSTPVPITQLSSGVTAIAGGTGVAGAGVPNSIHNLAIMNGGLYAWGDNAYGQLGDGTTTQRLAPVAITGMTSGVTSVAVGERQSLAVLNGNVYAWGYNGQGQLGNGTFDDSLVPIHVPGLSNIVQVAGTVDTSYALAGDGSLWTWGSNINGELGEGDFVNHNTPQHIFASPGFVFTSISDGNGWHVIATVSAVPEPASCAVLGLGITALMMCRKRK